MSAALALVLTATVSTSSITSTRVELYRDAVRAVHVAERYASELALCDESLSQAMQQIEAPYTQETEALPSWLWPAGSVAVLASFALGFALASSSSR